MPLEKENRSVRRTQVVPPPVRKTSKPAKHGQQEQRARRVLSDLTTSVSFNTNEDEDKRCDVCTAGKDSPKFKSAPYIKCAVKGENVEALIDTGAQITVFKRTRMDLPKANLKMKSATSHKAALYGPVTGVNSIRTSIRNFLMGQSGNS